MHNDHELFLINEMNSVLKDDKLDLLKINQLRSWVTELKDRAQETA